MRYIRDSSTLFLVWAEGIHRRMRFSMDATTMFLLRKETMPGLFHTVKQNCLGILHLTDR